MKKVWTLCLLLCSLTGSLLGGEIFPCHIYATQVQTLQCQVWHQGEEVATSYPISLLGSDEEIVISFDLLDAVPKRILYKVELCNANWQVNQRLSVSDYLDGAVGERWQSDESLASEGTYIPYRHYELRLGGSAELQPLLSGNYLVTAWCEEIQTEPIFIVGFALYEPLVTLSHWVDPKTSQGNYGRYQQVSVELSFDPTLSSDPLTELLVLIGQNGSSTRYQNLDRPTAIAPGRITFEGYNGATFAGGNEWRAYELLSEQMVNMNVERITSSEDTAHAYLYRDHQTRGSYIARSDANGYRKVRQADYLSEDNNYTTDYYWVTWCLDIDEPLSLGTPMLEGKAFEALPLEHRTLRYNRDTDCFELTQLVKGGYVSYRYTTETSPQPLATNAIEGDYYQTENQYTILVYNTAPMLRHQRLIAVEQSIL